MLRGRHTSRSTDSDVLKQEAPRIREEPSYGKQWGRKIEVSPSLAAGPCRDAENLASHRKRPDLPYLIARAWLTGRQLASFRGRVAGSSDDPRRRLRNTPEPGAKREWVSDFSHVLTYGERCALATSTRPHRGAGSARRRRHPSSPVVTRRHPSPRVGRAGRAGNRRVPSRLGGAFRPTAAAERWRCAGGRRGASPGES